MSDATRMLLATPSHHGLDTAVLAEAIDAVLLTGDRRLADAPGVRCSVEVMS